MRFLIVILLSVCVSFGQSPFGFSSGLMQGNASQNRPALTADLLVTFEGGSSGDVPTVSWFSNSTYGVAGTWTVENGGTNALFVSSRTIPILEPIFVNGASYSTNTTTGLSATHLGQTNWGQFNFTTPITNNFSAGFYVQFPHAGSNNQNIDHFQVNDNLGSYLVLSTKDGNSAGFPQVTAHSKITPDGPPVTFTNGVWYWASLLWDRTNALGKISLWDTRTWTLAGTSVQPDGGVVRIAYFRIGRIDAHDAYWPYTNFYDSLIVSTSGRWPLLPSSTMTVASGPTLTITNPASNGNVTDSSVSIAGTASGGNGLQFVKVATSLSSTNWSAANGTTNWSTTLTLSAGTNTVYAYVQDLFGQFSTTNSVTFNVAPALSIDNSISGTTTGNDTFGKSGSSTYLACKIMASNSVTISKITAPIYKVGTPTITVAAYIYSNGADIPGSIVSGGSSTNTIATSGLGTSEGAASEWTGLTASLTAGTVYWIVFKAVSLGDASNYVAAPWVTAGPPSGTESIMGGNTTPTWSRDSTTRRLKLTTYY